MCDDDDGEPKWLFRGVPEESDEVVDVHAIGEVLPPRRERTEEAWRDYHMAGETDTGYTSWTSIRSIAEAAAADMSEAEDLSGSIVIFRVRTDTIDPDDLFDGRDDEFEYLIRGRVEGVEISDSEEDE